MPTYCGHWKQEMCFFGISCLPPQGPGLGHVAIYQARTTAATPTPKLPPAMMDN